MSIHLIFFPSYQNLASLFPFLFRIIPRCQEFRGLSSYILSQFALSTFMLERDHQFYLEELEGACHLSLALGMGKSS